MKDKRFDKSYIKSIVDDFCRGRLVSVCSFHDNIILGRNLATNLVVVHGSPEHAIPSDIHHLLAYLREFAFTPTQIKFDRMPVPYAWPIGDNYFISFRQFIFSVSFCFVENRHARVFD